jgi:hypothetical protein
LNRLAEYASKLLRNRLASVNLCESWVTIRICALLDTGIPVENLFTPERLDA